MAHITQEGSLQAPTRHALAWQSDDFYNQDKLYAELERVFDICHGCRRCVSLCQAFPTLFDLVDESATLEVDGVDKKDYQKVVDQCYLCDLCYMTKCPYVPPHEWNIDFPHLMLRAKANVFKTSGASTSAKLLASPQQLGKLVSTLKAAPLVNWFNKLDWIRGVLAKVLNVHQQANIPLYHNTGVSKRVKDDEQKDRSKYKVAVFTTCYGEHNDPQSVVDLVDVLKHNGVSVKLMRKTECCGMPKMELGDLNRVAEYAKRNKKILMKAVDDGYKLMAPIPSCVLMFKNELPMMLPTDNDIKRIAQAFYDPFEYLDFLHKEGILKTDFVSDDKKVLYHIACHQRVQNMGAKTKKILSLIPNLKLEIAERCSGHDGTYGVKKDTYTFAVKIAKPIVRKITPETDYVISDCIMAGQHIASIARNQGSQSAAIHPITLVKQAYRRS